MKRLAPLGTLLKCWLVFYLVSLGVSLPADGRLELGELAMGLYYDSLSLLRAPASWVAAALEFLARR